jgi:hypothetical protein
MTISSFEIYWTDASMGGWAAFKAANQSAQSIRLYLALQNMMALSQEAMSSAEYIEAKSKAGKSLKEANNGQTNISIDTLTVLSAVLGARGWMLELLWRVTRPFQAIMTSRELLEGIQEQKEEADVVAAKATATGKLFTEVEV